MAKKEICFFKLRDFSHCQDSFALSKDGKARVLSQLVTLLSPLKSCKTQLYDSVAGLKDRIRHISLFLLSAKTTII